MIKIKKSIFNSKNIFNILTIVIASLSVIISFLDWNPLLKSDIKIKPILFYYNSERTDGTRYIMQMTINSLNKNFNVKDVNMKLKLNKQNKDVKFLFDHKLDFKGNVLTFNKKDLLQYLDILKKDFPRTIYCTFLVDEIIKEEDMLNSIFEFEFTDYNNNTQTVQLNGTDFNKYLSGVEDVEFPELIE